MAEIEADGLYKAAWQAHRNGQHDDAISLLEQAISVTSCSIVKSAYLATKGGFYCRMNDYEKGIAACEEALSLEPHNYYALTQLGLAHLRLCEFWAAAKYLERAAEIRPDHNVLTVLAKAQLPVDPSAARKSATRALELEPSWSEAKAVLDAAEKAERGPPD